MKDAGKGALHTQHSTFHSHEAMAPSHVINPLCAGTGESGRKCPWSKNKNHTKKPPKKHKRLPFFFNLQWANAAVTVCAKTIAIAFLYSPPGSSNESLPATLRGRGTLKRTDSHSFDAIIVETDEIKTEHMKENKGSFLYRQSAP